MADLFRNSGKSAAEMQTSVTQGYNAADRELEQTRQLLSIQLSNAEQLARKQRELLKDVANDAQTKGAEVINQLLLQMAQESLSKLESVRASLTAALQQALDETGLHAEQLLTNLGVQLKSDVTSVIDEILDQLEEKGETKIASLIRRYQEEQKKADKDLHELRLRYINEELAAREAGQDLHDEDSDNTTSDSGFSEDSAKSVSSDSVSTQRDTANSKIQVELTQPSMAAAPAASAAKAQPTTLAGAPMPALVTSPTPTPTQVEEEVTPATEPVPATSSLPSSIALDASALEPIVDRLVSALGDAGIALLAATNGYSTFVDTYLNILSTNQAEAANISASGATSSPEVVTPAATSSPELVTPTAVSQPTSPEVLPTQDAIKALTELDALRAALVAAAIEEAHTNIQSLSNSIRVESESLDTLLRSKISDLTQLLIKAFEEVQIPELRSTVTLEADVVLNTEAIQESISGINTTLTVPVEPVVPLEDIKTKLTEAIQESISGINTTLTVPVSVSSTPVDVGASTPILPEAVNNVPETVNSAPPPPVEGSGGNQVIIADYLPTAISHLNDSLVVATKSTSEPSITAPAISTEEIAISLADRLLEPITSTGIQFLAKVDDFTGFAKTYIESYLAGLPVAGSTGEAVPAAESVSTTVSAVTEPLTDTSTSVEAAPTPAPAAPAAPVETAPTPAPTPVTLSSETSNAATPGPTGAELLQALPQEPDNSEERHKRRLLHIETERRSRLRGEQDYQKLSEAGLLHNKAVMEAIANAGSDGNAEIAAVYSEILNMREAEDKALHKSQVDRLRQAANAELAMRTKVNDALLSQGYSREQILASGDDDYLKNRLEAIEEARKKELENLAELSDEERAADEARINAKYAKEANDAKKLDKNRKKLEEKAHKERMKQATAVASASVPDMKTALFGLSEEAKEEYMQKMRDEGYSDAEAKEALAKARGEAVKAGLDDLGKKMMETGEKIAQNQAAIDTRLQGSHYGINGVLAWRDLDWKIGTAVGASPFFKQEKVVENLQTLVDKGIAHNVDQRAFLMTISEKIATTFEAADGTLLKLIRIQQQDTTAARLGMESALTAFLNNMYSTTEYLTEAASAIRGNLYEASALMGAKSATAFEYQVQKWMGSLFSVGFSNTEGLSAAFGKLAAGDVSGITEGGMGNLLVMAADQAGLNISELLATGLDDSKTNTLFTAMVDYLAQIYNETAGSNVLAQQFANVYGLAASDLKAAANLAKSLPAVSKNFLDYDGQMQQLKNMANTMVLRTSMGEMMTNAMENLVYTMSAGLGNNPILYATYNIANMLDQVAEGINLPFLNVYGFGLDLNASVADLMKIGAMSGSVLGGLGKLIVSLGSGGGLVGSGMLKAFGIGDESKSVVTRGDGAGLLTTKAGESVSDSGYVGNSSSEDVQNKTVSDASGDSEKQMAEAKEENDDIKVKQVDEHVVQIYDLLVSLTDGTKALHVIQDTDAIWSSYREHFSSSNI